MKVNTRVGQPLLKQDSFVNSGLSPFKKSQVESFNNIKSKLQFDIEFTDEEGNKNENIEDQFPETEDIREAEDTSFIADKIRVSTINKDKNSICLSQSRSRRVRASGAYGTNKSIERIDEENSFGFGMQRYPSHRAIPNKPQIFFEKVPQTKPGSRLSRYNNKTKEEGICESNK